jgi:hypothetical protein
MKKIEDNIQIKTVAGGITSLLLQHIILLQNKRKMVFKAADSFFYK